MTGADLAGPSLLLDADSEFARWRWPEQKEASKHRGLHRALRIERATRNLYEKRLRELMPLHEFAECRRLCRGMALAGCIEPDPGNDDQRAI